MGQTLAERIDWEAANDPNRMVSAYAGDLRELMVELTARAERAEAALAAKVTPCAWVWNPTDDSDEVGAGHETQCGAWYSGDGSTPNFCPNCGRPVASY